MVVFHCLERRLALQHLEAVGGDEQRLARFIQPMVGAADALQHTRGALGRPDLHNEIDVAPLSSHKWEEIKPQVDHVIFPDGKRIILLAKGRLVNLGCGTGHPSYVMSSSFANQTIAQIELFTHADSYDLNKVYVLPKHLDEKVARLQLKKLGAMLTQLSPEQAAYIGVPQEGPYKPDTYRY